MEEEKVVPLFLITPISFVSVPKFSDYIGW